MSILLTVVTGSNVTYSDLGNRTFTAGLTDYDVTDEFSLHDLANSVELSASLVLGEVTLKNDAGDDISSVAELDSNIKTVYDVDNDGYVDTASLATTASYALFAENVLNALTASYVEWGDVANKPANLLSGSAQIATEISGAFTSASASIATDIAANIISIGDNTTDIQSLTSATSSYVLNDAGNGANQVIQGSITLTGDITAENLYVTTTSSSIIYQSGSTKFGDTLDDTHEFTGSLFISGSTTITDGDLIIGGLQVSSSIGDINNSIDSISSKTGSYATTGSNSFDGDIQITGSLIVTNEATFEAGVTGSSFTGSFVGDGSQLANIPLSWEWTAGRDSKNISAQFLRVADGIFSNVTPFICPVDCELIAVAGSSDGAATWDAEIYKDGILTETLTMTSVDNNYSAGYSSSFTAGSKVSLKLNGLSVDRPLINVWFREV